MATVSQAGFFNLQGFTDLGALAVGGRIYTYTQGTTTKKNAYTEATGTTVHTYTSDGVGGEYIALNARGELPAPLYLTSGSYDITYKTAAGATVWTRRADPLSLPASFTTAVIIGGEGINSTLKLRSTSGAGTTNPATTSDTIIFERGANGSQELGRFSPGGSLGIGTATPNVHAGDDGTTTRVCTVFAQTAPLFIGQTNRTPNAGNSIVSFEGYAYQQAAPHDELVAFRGVFEGATPGQLGGAAAILTKDDASTSFTEKVRVHANGNVLISNGGVSSANRAGAASTSAVLTIAGSAGQGVMELATGVADASGTIVGEQLYVTNQNSGGSAEKRIGRIFCQTVGATANQRGGQMEIQVKANAGALATQVTLTSTGAQVAGAFGCNTKSPQTAVSVGAASTDLATVVALCNQLRAALIANGICV